MFKDDLWGALEEYPEARKNLLEKGRQMLMKVNLQYLSHADEGEGWFSSILIIFYQEKMKKKLKVSNVCQTKAKQINFGFGKLWHIFFYLFLVFIVFPFPFFIIKLVFQWKVQLFCTCGRWSVLSSEGTWNLLYWIEGNVRIPDGGVATQNYKSIGRDEPPHN